MYRSHEETKVSTNQREPYYIHTANGREPVNPPRPTTSSNTQISDTASTLSTPLINPKHPPEICPSGPRSSTREKWHKLKEENEQRKSREVTRVSENQVAAITGRDQRGFKTGEEDGWTERQKDMEAKRAWECLAM